MGGSDPSGWSACTAMRTLLAGACDRQLLTAQRRNSNMCPSRKRSLCFRGEGAGEVSMETRIVLKCRTEAQHRWRDYWQISCALTFDIRSRLVRATSICRSSRLGTAHQYLHLAVSAVVPHAQFELQLLRR